MPHASVPPEGTTPATESAKRIRSHLALYDDPAFMAMSRVLTDADLLRLRSIVTDEPPVEGSPDVWEPVPWAGRGWWSVRNQSGVCIAQKMNEVTAHRVARLPALERRAALTPPEAER